MDSLDIGEVKISTIEYNELRDFKSLVERNDMIMVYPSWNGGEGKRFFTKDEANKSLLNDINGLNKRIAEFNAEIYNLKNPQPKETTLQDIKNMNILQFISWKRKK